jgi:HK97 family phage portal protein
MATPDRLFPARGLPVMSGPAADAPKRLLAPVEQKATAIQYAPDHFWLEGNAYRTDLPDVEVIGVSRAYRASALVYACMTLVASKTTEAPLWIAQEDADGNETWLPGTATHPLATLLERPNPDQEMADLIEELVLFYLMGPTLLVLNRDRIGRVASMYAFDYAAFTVKPAWVRGEYRRNGVFTVTTAGGDRRDFGPDDVIYLRPPGGVGAVDAALTNIRLGADLRAAVKTSLRRAMRPGSVTTLDTTPDQQILEHFKQQLSQYEGATGKNMVLAGEGIEWKQVPVNLKDLDLGPLDDATEAAVCSAFKVPPEMVRAHVALKHNGGLADAIKPAQQLYYDQAQFPLWERIGRALTRGLLRPVDPDPLRYVRFVTDRIRALQPDLVANANVGEGATRASRGSTSSARS